MNTPQFSFVIPIYNVEKWLPRCVDSILSQNAPSFEIILVDDGSTDGSGKICDTYAASNPGITVIHKECGGVGSARNAGLENAQGEYIAFVDPDDYITPDYLDFLLPVIREHQPDIAEFGFFRITDEKQERHLQPYSPGLHSGQSLRELQLDAIGPKYTLDYNLGRILSVWSGLYRRSFLEQHGFRFRSERLILNEDYLFYLQAMQKAETVYVLPCALYCYVLRNGSLSHRRRPNMYMQKKALYAAYLENTDVENAEEASRLRNFYIDSIYNCFVNECIGSPKKEAIRNIRVLLRDPLLAECLKTNKHLANTVKTKIICNLMRRKMAWVMYGLYRAITR